MTIESKTLIREIFAPFTRKGNSSAVFFFMSKLAIHGREKYRPAAANVNINTKVRSFLCPFLSGISIYYDPPPQFKKIEKWFWDLLKNSFKFKIYAPPPTQ